MPTAYCPAIEHEKCFPRRPGTLISYYSQGPIRGAFMTSLLRGSSALVCAFAIAAGMAATGQAQTPVKFTLDWRFEEPAAPFTVALDKGYFKVEGLEVTIDTGSGSRESIPRVASGTYDIGAGDVNSLVRFRDENPTIDLKAVMMVYDRPPFAIVGRKSKGIGADPRSLMGKK